jgi:predicted metal-dependent peptidase
MDYTPFDLALIKAKVAFMDRNDAVFMTTVCLHLNIFADHSCSTAWVNGTDMGINPDFFIGLPLGQRVFVLAHETKHVVHQHIERKGERDHLTYNYAGDYVINLDLKDAKYEIWPPCLIDEKFRGMTTEQVYDALISDPEEKPNEADHGDIRPSDKPPEEYKEYLDQILVKAVMAAKSAGDSPGSIPGDVQVYLDGLLTPKLPMANHLKQFFTQIAKNDYSYRRPNRRYYPQFYLPSLVGTDLMHIAFAFDMSCSVQDTDTKRYVSELYGVLRMLKPDKLTLVQFDTEIISVDVVKNVYDLMNVKLTGRGGTWIEPLMTWAQKHKPAALVVFTDGEFDQPEFNPGVPVLWMIHGSTRAYFRCPFGRIVTFEV